MKEANQKQTQAQIREFTADGTLTAHRSEDGDHHIVNVNGNDARSTFTETVPATRTAVVEGESLWTIPENWEHVVETDTEITLHIPETDVDVKLTNPRNCRVVDADYTVKTVGEYRVNMVSDATDRAEMDSLLDEIDGNEDRYPAEYIESLRALDAHWDEFAAEFREMAEDAGVAKLDYERDGDAEARVTGWINLYETLDATDIIQNLLEIDSDAAKYLSDALAESGAITVDPDYGVTVDSFRGSDSLCVPNGYRITALTEAGCSPAEAVDYLMCDIHGLTQTEWAAVRGKDQSSVSENVNSARRTL